MIACMPMGETPNRIRKLRETRGMTQDDLVARLGLSIATIQRAERGERVSPATVIRQRVTAAVPSPSWSGLDARRKMKAGTPEPSATSSSRFDAVVEYLVISPTTPARPGFAQAFLHREQDVRDAAARQARIQRIDSERGLRHGPRPRSDRYALADLRGRALGAWHLENRKRLISSLFVLMPSFESIASAAVRTRHAPAVRRRSPDLASEIFRRVGCDQVLRASPT